jgi:hypothetical protein
MTNGPVRKPSIDVPNDIMASNTSTCEGDFQSGKRFNLRMDAAAPINLVFDTRRGLGPQRRRPTDPY